METEEDSKKRLESGLAAQSLKASGIEKWQVSIRYELIDLSGGCRSIEEVEAVDSQEAIIEALRRTREYCDVRHITDVNVRKTGW